ncbi:MAG TPA: serine protease [Candidatus Thermoplasmatota archaeon]
MTVIHGMEGDSLDLILHSPGGSAEATEAIVTYIRSKFKDVRVIVPQAAMSAATMLACSADRITMGRHSSLGPIDPQVLIPSGEGRMLVPAYAILAQFRKAQEECKDPSKLASWYPMLSQYGPGLLVQCETQTALARNLVQTWLRTYMLKGNNQAAETIASTLCDHSRYGSHARHIGRDEARRIGLVIDDLEADQVLQDLVLSYFHATTLTFDGTIAVKIFENQNGRAFVKHYLPGVARARAPPEVERRDKGSQ